MSILRHEWKVRKWKEGVKRVVADREGLGKEIY